MKPIIDLNKEYGLVFDGGGARGAYQIGAWRALSEAGVKISAVAGTSVGALNGALVCMGDLEKAGHIWKEMAFSRVMDVDDELMEQFFDGEASIREILKGLWKKLADGGIDITPLKELIHEVVDEEKIRKCGKEFCLLTFSVSDRCVAGSFGSWCEDQCSSGYFCGRPEWRPCLYGRSGESRTYLERDGIFPCYGCG